MTVLEDVRLGRTKTPYVNAADAALRACGMWQDEAWMLLGLTGLGFHLIVDPGTCPSGPTSYDWTAVHSQAMARIGVRTRCVEYTGEKHSSRKNRHPHRDRYEQLRDESVAMVKTSIDRGIPAVFRAFDWQEFAVITGYDDDAAVFFVSDITGEADPVLYTNLGRPHGLPSLFVQVFDERAEFDLAEAARASLDYAIECWNGTAWPKPAGYGYAVGATAYETLISALERADTDPLGLRYILMIVADARAGVAKYVRRLDDDRVLPKLGKAADLYEVVAASLDRASQLLPAQAPFERPLEREVLPETVPLLRAAFEAEQRAVDSLR